MQQIKESGIIDDEEVLLGSNNYRNTAIDGTTPTVDENVQLKEPSLNNHYSFGLQDKKNHVKELSQSCANTNLMKLIGKAG